MCGGINRSSEYGVYPRGGADVNPTGEIARRRHVVIRNRRTRTQAVIILTLLAANLACAPNRVDVATEPDQAFYPAGIWYGVESMPSSRRDQLARRLDVDLATINRMGLNIVLFRHIDSEVFATVAAAAQRHHLKIVLPDRSVQYYVMTGGPGLCSVPPSWFIDAPGSMRGALWAVDLGHATDRTSAERLERISAMYRANQTLPPTFAQTTGPIPNSVAFVTSKPTPGEPVPVLPDDVRAGRLMMTLRCDHQPDESSADAVRRWLWQFHAGLADGLTEGLIIDQFHNIPGYGPALAATDGEVGVQRINAVKRMVARMRRWGPLLDHLDVKKFPAQPGVGDALELTLFAQGRRRFLLVFNRSRSEYLRTSVTLEDVIDGLPARRLVEVPGDAKLTLGAVTEARHGGFTLQADIAPGDARLYEVF